MSYTTQQRVLTTLDLLLDAFLNWMLIGFAVVLLFYREWDRALLCLIASYIIELGYGNKITKLREQIEDNDNV